MYGYFAYTYMSSGQRTTSVSVFIDLKQVLLFSACRSVHCVHAVSTEVRRGCGSPGTGTGVTGSCEPPWGWLGIELGTTELALQTLTELF